MTRFQQRGKIMSMNILIAAGGTGGHVFPAIAVADKIKQLDPNSTITFVGTSDKFEAQAIPKAGYNIEFLPAVKLKGTSNLHKIKAILKLPMIILKAANIIRRKKIDAVVGFGGYVSGPAVLAGWMLRKRTYICEQNTIPGLANRWLGKFVEKVFASFDYSRRYFPKDKFILTGNPVRSSFYDIGLPRTGEHDRFHLLVIGGSQGAKAINDVIPLALDLLKKKNFKISITHQTGDVTYDATKKLHDAVFDGNKEIKAFIQNMPQAYVNSDLVISRAGATSIAEIIATKTPSILIPLPTAIDNHQHVNAEVLEQQHAAILLPQLELTPLRLANEISTFIQDPYLGPAMRKRLKRLGVKDAALEVSKRILKK